MIVVGITGTNGAGKGTVVETLVEKGFTHFSARGFIIEEIKKRGLPVNRDNTNFVANDLRKNNHPAIVIEKLYEQAVANNINAVIESVRTIGEAEFLKSKGALIWAVDADRKTRYERVVLRGTDLDKIPFEKFCEQEDKEMNQREKFDMNIKGVMSMADHIFLNDKSKEDLKREVEKVLERLK